MKRTTEWLIVGIFLSPLAILLLGFGDVAIPSTSEVAPFLRAAFLQGALSAIFSLILGGLLAVGLLTNLSLPMRRRLEVFFFLPGVLPSIFVVLAVLRIYSFFGIHPVGLLGVVSANVIMSFGIVGVYLSRAFHDKVGRFAELAFVEGASALKVLRTLLALVRRDLATLFWAVFVFSFLSFSVPLALGGLEGANLEVQIYRKILSGNANEALGLCLLQILFVGLFAEFIPKQSAVRKVTSANLSYIGRKSILMFFALLNCLILLAPTGHFFLASVR